MITWDDKHAELQGRIAQEIIKKCASEYGFDSPMLKCEFAFPQHERDAEIWILEGKGENNGLLTIPWTLRGRPQVKVGDTISILRKRREHCYTAKGVPEVIGDAHFTLWERIRCKVEGIYVSGFKLKPLSSQLDVGYAFWGDKAADHRGDYCTYCGAYMGPHGEERQGFDCTYCWCN